MPSLFVALARDAQKIVFAHHGEAWLWTPMAPAADRNAPAVADPARAPATLVGIYFEKAAQPLIRNGYDPRTDQRPGVSNAHPRVEFPGDIAAAQQVVNAGDILTRLSNGRRYVVASTLTKKTGVQVCTVNAMGAA